MRLRSLPDGWDFTPDVGNGQKRGEIFTPLWIVKKMITDSGMLPEKAVYDNDYNSKTSDSLKYISNRINEPAIGTGNYTSTILYHKLRYALTEALHPNNENSKTVRTIRLLEENELPYYHYLFLTAIGSMYSFDIDVGNCETVFNRLLGSKIPLNSEVHKEYWTDYLIEKLTVSQKLYDRDKKNIRKQVQESLDSAQINWGKFAGRGKGVVDTAYFEATGRMLPIELRVECENILKENVKLFNGVKEEDTVSGFYCPGTNNVEWSWWSFENVGEFLPVVSKVRVSLQEQLIRGELRQLECRKGSNIYYSDEDLKRKKELEAKLFKKNTLTLF